MLRCFVCNIDVGGSLKILFTHLKNVHGIYERNAKYSCRQGHCCRSFSEKYVFSKHILSHHSSDVDDKNETTCSMTNSSCEAVINESTTNSPLPEHANKPSNNLDVMELASAFICEAKSKVASLSSVSSIVQSCKTMFEKIMDDLLCEFNLESKKMKASPSSFTSLVNKLRKYRNPFSGVETEYSHRAYLERMELFITPAKFTIGSKQSFAKDKNAGIIKPVLESVNGQYVSIAETIAALNKRTNLVHEAVMAVSKSPSVNEMTEYSSFLDGSAWKAHPLRNCDVILIRLYGDDFEPANPLGSRKSLYKIGCIYFQLECLPTHILSKTENTFLSLCYCTSDVKEFGWIYVLRPLINELKILETTGIALKINGETKSFRVVLSGITGDNLFLNGILGFVESFTASYPCRICAVRRPDFKNTLSENSDCLRDVSSYNAAVDEINVQATGIKQNCAFNELIHLHAAENNIQDIMHDVFEGICAYDLPLICRKLIERKYFDLTSFNHRIQTFDFGYHDRSNKMPVVTSLDSEMWTFDACQLWCGTRVLSMAVGDLVKNETDEVWQMYLMLRNILDIILAPKVQDVHLDLLSTTITEYLQMRAKLFKDNTIKNKHHHLVHYPGLIRKVGPLSRFWCMRFESKHQRSKRILHVSGNFKNILQTLAVRHQYDVAFRLLNCGSDGTEVTVGSGCVITLSDLDDGVEIGQSISQSLSSELFQANWMEFRGVRYKPGCCVLFQVKDGQPTFVHVDNILVISSSQVWMCGEQLVTSYFSSHYHAWVVERQLTRQTVCINPSHLYIHPTPVTVHNIKTKDGEGNELQQSIIGLRYLV